MDSYLLEQLCYILIGNIVIYILLIIKEIVELIEISRDLKLAQKFKEKKKSEYEKFMESKIKVEVIPAYEDDEQLSLLEEDE